MLSKFKIIALSRELGNPGLTNNNSSINWCAENYGENHDNDDIVHVVNSEWTDEQKHRVILITQERKKGQNFMKRVKAGGHGNKFHAIAL